LQFKSTQKTISDRNYSNFSAALGSSASSPYLLSLPCSLQWASFPDLIPTFEIALQFGSKKSSRLASPASTVFTCKTSFVLRMEMDVARFALVAAFDV
jgi:hypothetical protein